MKIVAFFFLLFFSVSGLAAGGSSIPLKEAGNNLRDVDSLRRGAELFVNRCSVCHSLKYVRYETIANHLGFDKAEAESKLTRGQAKLEDFVTSSLSDKEAIATYGIKIPDLSLVTKYKSPDWVYTYLQAFYVDDEGKSDNYLYPGTAMLNILAGDQGVMKAVYQQHGSKPPTVVGNEPATQPTSQADKLFREEREAKFNETTRDITNFLTFASEPSQIDRIDLGIKVILFLLVLLVVLVMLKREYWRDIK